MRKFLFWYLTTLGNFSLIYKDSSYVLRLAWIGMLSGVVIEKIQDANKVSKEDDSIDEETWMEIKVEQ